MFVTRALSHLLAMDCDNHSTNLTSNQVSPYPCTWLPTVDKVPCICIYAYHGFIEPHVT